MAQGAVIARIVSQWSDKGVKQAEKDLKKYQKNIGNFAKDVRKKFLYAAGAAAALAVKIGKDAVAAAEADARSAMVLANTLKNVTGATQDGIAAVEAYIDQQEMLSTVADDELRQSLNALVVSTKDVNAAMYLQGIALDVAAGTGKDLQAVTMALVKAHQGNFGALQKLGVPLDKNIIKSKDFVAATKALTAAYSGSAKAIGDASPLKRLQISYTRLLETLGYALLPALTQFTTYLSNVLIPTVQRWITQNEVELQRALKNTANVFHELGKIIFTVAKVIAQNDAIFKGFVAILATIQTAIYFATALKALQTLASVVVYLLVQMGLLTVETTVASTAMGGYTAATNTATAATIRFNTAITSLLKKLGWVVFGVTAFFTGLSWWRNKYKKEEAKFLAESSIANARYVQNITGGFSYIEDATRRARGEQDRYTQAILDGFKPIEDATKKAREDAKAQADLEAYLNKIKKEQAAQDAKNAALKAKRDKLNLELMAKYKRIVSPTGEEYDLINVEAATKRAKLQENELKSELEKLKLLSEQIKLLEYRNKLAERYEDVLKILSADADKQPALIAAVAQKWGVTIEAVNTYLSQFQAISDGDIGINEVIDLAKKWGSTQEQAQKYLYFLKYISDSILSDAELEEIKSKWGMNETQAKQYADFVGKVHDGLITDTEVENLMKDWQLTIDEVVDYIKQIGAPVNYTGNNATYAGYFAEIGWKNAKAALEAYLALLAAGTGVITGGTNKGGFTPGSGNDPAVIAAASAAAAAAAAAAADAADALAESEKALAESTAALESATTLGAIRTATTTEEINNAVNLATLLGESASDIANAMFSGLTGQGMDAANAASSARYTGMAIAEMQRQQAEIAEAAAAYDRALSGGMVRARDAELFGMGATSRGEYVEGFRAAFQSSTLSNASGLSGGNLMAGGVNVTVNVSGSVTSEQDLVETIRNGLLAGQTNGYSINLQAI